MNTSSNKILQTLVCKIPSIRTVYNILDLNVSSGYYEETNNIVSNFTNPKIIITIGFTTTAYFIQRESKIKYHLLRVEQEAFYSKESTGKIKNDIIRSITWKDYVPNPLIKKIVLIDSFDNGVLEGEILSEWTKGKFVQGTVDFSDINDFSKEFVDYRGIIADFLKRMEF